MTELGAAVGESVYLSGYVLDNRGFAFRSQTGTAFVFEITASRATEFQPRFQYSAAKRQRKLQKALAPFVLSSSNFFSLFHLFFVSMFVFVYFSLLLFILVFSLLSPYFFRSVFPSSFCRSCFHFHISFVFFLPFAISVSFCFFVVILSLFSPLCLFLFIFPFFYSRFLASFSLFLSFCLSVKFLSFLLSFPISFVFPLLSLFLSLSVSVFCGYSLSILSLSILSLSILSLSRSLCVFHGLLRSLQPSS